MITTEEGPVLRAELAPGARAYVDGDWAAAPPGTGLPAIVVEPDGSIRRDGGPSFPLPDGMEPDAAAALALRSVAVEAAAAAGGTPVEVIGAGFVAAAVRELLGTRAEGGGGEAPAAIVDTTGDPQVLRDATERLAELGTLVLAGEPLGRAAQIDLYPHVHLRGLEFVAVRPPLHAGPPAPAAAEDTFSASPQAVASGEPLPRSALWYRLDA